MKKALIAGAASTVLAAMPVLGVFADTTLPDGTIYGTPLIDRFSLEISEVCTLSRQETEHTNPQVQNVSGTWDPTDTNSDLVSATLVAGTAYENLATSSFNVTCNNATGGYAVTVDTTALMLGGTSSDDDWNYANVTSFSGNDSQWFLTSSAKMQDSAYQPISDGGQVWAVNSGTAVNSADFTINYSFKPKTTQKTGTYTGSATYALINL